MTSFRPFAAFVSVTLALGAGCGSSRTDAPAPGSGPSSPPGGTSTSDPPLACATSAASDVAVANEDLNGYPPYAIDGCTLVYVSSSGALVSRDLVSAAETELAPATSHPRRPTASAGVVAWEATTTKDVVMVLAKGETVAKPLDPFAAAREPRANGSVVVFTGWKSAVETSDTDVYLYDATKGEIKLVLGGAGQQRFADVSSAFVAVTDFSEDPDGTFNRNQTDLADIVLVDRQSGAVTRRAQPGKQAFPTLVSGDRLAYMSWGEIHPEPKLQLYQLKTGPLVADVSGDKLIATVQNDGELVRYAGADGTLEWIERSPAGKASMMRAPADGSRAPAAVAGLDGLTLFAPVSTAGLTILATSAPSPTFAPKLRAVAR